jgi:DNA polymerase V
MNNLKNSTVSCGLFGISEDHLENYQSLDQRFVKNKTSTFFFEASGDSMMPLILPGDVLVVDRSIKAQFGRVVVVIYEQELVCKRLVRELGRVVLRSDNPRYPDLYLSQDRELMVWGVVRAVIHPLLEQELKA